MPTIDIRGRVFYFGGRRPLPNGEVEIIDVDSGGNGDDVIFRGRTGIDGTFQGTSTEWQDRNVAAVPKPPPFTGTVEVDVPDVLMLMARIREGSRDSGRVPFILAPPNAPPTPITVTWGDTPRPVVIARVNGQDCTDGIDLQKKIRASLEAGTSPTKIEVYGPEGILFQSLAGKTLDQLKTLVEARLPGAAGMLYKNPVGAAELMAVALIILCVGAAYTVSAVATAVAIGLILALIFGYADISVGASTGPQGQTGVTFSVKKSPPPPQG